MLRKDGKQRFLYNNLNQSCDIFQNFTMLIQCIDRKTFDLSEILDQVKNGDGSKQDITNNVSWSEDLGNFDLGKAYTLNNSYQIGIDTKRFEILFKKDLNHTVYIHDPHYYIYTLNPDTVPKGSLKILNKRKLLRNNQILNLNQLCFCL